MTCHCGKIPDFVCAECIEKNDKVSESAVLAVMPIMIGVVGRHEKTIPFSLLNEQQAQENHGQTLERLAGRGGLAPCEALAIIHGRRWKRMDEKASLRKLLAIIETTNKA